MRCRNRRRSTSALDAMVSAVSPLPPSVRRVMYRASGRGSLRRRTWVGCPLNRAAVELGRPAGSRGEAAWALGVPLDTVTSFLRTWDGLWGLSDAECTELLRDALLRAGLFEWESARTPAPQPPSWNISMRRRPEVRAPASATRAERSSE
jgi:hypothetical protein